MIIGCMYKIWTDITLLYEYDSDKLYLSRYMMYHMDPAPAWTVLYLGEEDLNGSIVRRAINNINNINKPKYEAVCTHEMHKVLWRDKLLYVHRSPQQHWKLI